MNTILLPLRKQFSQLLHGAMAACFILSAVCAVAQTAPDSVVYIGSTTLPQFMKVYNNGDLLMRGNYDGGINSGTPLHYPPVEGAGNRLMWMPERGAFRAGGIEDLPFYGSFYWDNAWIGYYSTAAGYNVRASGHYSTALGNWCTASGTGSFAVGESNIASGAVSIALGYHAHTNARQGSFVFADRSTTDTFRAGTNHSANWRVSGGFRIFTSFNLSTGISIQSGVVANPWDGQAGEAISTSTGAYLSTAGVWQSVSDVNRKHLFESISGEDLLSRLRLLPIREWSYKVESDGVRHIGPTAQDFSAAFGLGSDQRSIGTVDAEGVALAGVQALDNRTLAQATELAKLKAENGLLQSRLTALENAAGSTGSKAFAPIALILLVGIAVWSTVYRKRARE